MKKLICISFFILSCISLPSIALAQSHVDYRYPTPARVYPGYVYRCYTVLLPFPHEMCEYVRVYTPSRARHLPPPPHRQNNHKPHQPVHNQPRHSSHR